MTKSELVLKTNALHRKLEKKDYFLFEKFEKYVNGRFDKIFGKGKHDGYHYGDLDEVELHRIYDKGKKLLNQL